MLRSEKILALCAVFAVATGGELAAQTSLLSVPTEPVASLSRLESSSVRVSLEQAFTPSFTSNVDDEPRNPKSVGFLRFSQGLSIFAPLGSGVSAFGRLAWSYDHYGLRGYNSSDVSGQLSLTKRWDNIAATVFYSNAQDHARVFAEHYETIQVLATAMRAEFKPADGWTLTPAVQLRRRWSQGNASDTMSIQPSLALSYSTCKPNLTPCWSAGLTARTRWSRYDQRFEGRQRIDRLSVLVADASYQFTQEWRVGATVTFNTNRSNKPERSYRTLDAAPMLVLSRMLYP
ncbi:MAG: hypothetical protein ACRDBH_05170 [Bosea sp. (in: a-proteobacteria)]